MRLVTRGDAATAMRLVTGGDAVTAMRLVTGGDAVTVKKQVTGGDAATVKKQVTGGDAATVKKQVTGGLTVIRSTTWLRKQTPAPDTVNACASHVSGGNDEDGDCVTRDMILCLTGFKGSRVYLPNVISTN